MFLFFKKGCPGWGVNPGSLISFIFSFHHFTAEQLLPFVGMFLA
jgi:hypothetical protein